MDDDGKKGATTPVRSGEGVDEVWSHLSFFP